jgi:hypothetical protein
MNRISRDGKTIWGIKNRIEKNNRNPFKISMKIENPNG